jgi:glycosyltransferase involved in cell wall biosynthesis
MNSRQGVAAAEQFDVCIVGLKCWGYMAQSEDPRYIGGIETDLVTLARMLAKAGKKVALVTYDEGQPKITEVDGVSVFSSFSPNDGLPVVRFIFPRATKLIETIRSIRARNFVQMGAGVETGWTGIACRLARDNRRFIFLTGGDRDCMKNLPAIKRLRERMLYRIGLRLANQVVTQTDTQAGLMLGNFGRESGVLRLPNQLAGDRQARIDKSVSESLSCNGSGKHLRVLWVGRLDRNKRPDRLLELATRYPEYRFDVVGEANTSDSYSIEFKKSAQQMINIHLHGKVSPKKIVEYYQSADLLCCTSEMEGFPATFLEAWSFGVPTISTVDPGGIISKFNVGVSVSSIGELSETLNYDTVQRRHNTWVHNASQLYLREFSPAASLEKFNHLLGAIP